MKRNREKHLTEGKGVLSGFKNSLRLETMNFDQHQSARLGDFLQQYLKSPVRLHRGRSGWEEAHRGRQAGGAQEDERTNCLRISNPLSPGCRRVNPASTVLHLRPAYYSVHTVSDSLYLSSFHLSHLFKKADVFIRRNYTSVGDLNLLEGPSSSEFCVTLIRPLLSHFFP